MSITTSPEHHSVCVAIITHNSELLIREALQSVPDWAEKIVVDNASDRRIADYLTDIDVRVIENPSNAGFGAACNIAAKAARSDYIFFMNPDARLTDGALEELLRAAEEMGASGGAYGPCLTGPEGPIPPRAGTMLDTGGSTYIADPGEAPRAIYFLSGAALLIERELFLELGGFDEKIFLYLEDDDLCLRLRRIGRPPVLVPKAQVFHFEKDQSQTSSRVIRLKNYHATRSYLYLLEKHSRATNLARLRLKALRRLIWAAITLDRVRFAKNAGRLMALQGLPLV
ncbi:glycosyltransferase family 2 protein [Limibaculum sp. FT325]|uniref:glycosyltransferase family 2 protein n=1 Tax=Thermohalobaculum sediminis TaxID=2939436 RepID=UPI0020BF13E4|nr:glycosyltransferase family 2 protein [Limibaculum sediminis]MCL5777441.1 glycosyltransferase family 2 protein [Limibaculum sediminis]